MVLWNDDNKSLRNDKEYLLTGCHGLYEVEKVTPKTFSGHRFEPHRACAPRYHNGDSAVITRIFHEAKLTCTLTSSLVSKSSCGNWSLNFQNFQIWNWWELFSTRTNGPNTKRENNGNNKRKLSSTLPITSSGISLWNCSIMNIRGFSYGSRWAWITCPGRRQSRHLWECASVIASSILDER